MNTGTQHPIEDASTATTTEQQVTEMQSVFGGAANAEQHAILRHDMINCLTAMRLNLEIMRRKHILEEMQIEPLSQNLARMEMLIQDWRHLNESEQRQDISRFNLNEGVSKVVEANRPGAQLKQQALLLYVDEASAVMIGLESEILRAVDNLISNAIKYTPNGGTVAVSLKVVEDRAFISIRDNGIGIPEDEQKHVFESYYRAWNAVNNGISGTGLGLSQVKDAVERHGGTIYLCSKFGQGTQIDVQLPLVPEVQESGVEA